MKKVLSIMLVLLMMLSLVSLAACSKEEKTDAPAAGQGENAGGETTGEVTKEMLEASKPNEYVQEKIDAGMAPLVYFAAPLLTDTFVVGIKDGLQADLEALGFSYSYGDCEGNMSRMIDVVENATTMGASACIVMAYVEGLGDVCGAASEAGTSVIVFGAVPEFEVDGMVVLDQGEQGYQAGKMISAWIDQRYPDAGEGEVEAMLMLQVANKENKDRSEGYQRGLAEDKRVKVVYEATEQVQSVDEGFNYAQEGFTVSDNIRVILTFSISTAIGANNYVTSHFADKLDEFGIFCNSQDPSLMELIEAAKTNDGSCIRGTIGQGGDPVYQMVLECTIDVLLGGAEFGYIKPDRTFSITSFDYHYDSTDA